MEILVKACGEYQTNCYIVKHHNKEIIIDPGVGAFEWIQQNVKNPVAILNTHGHFDHVWSNTDVKEYYNIPIYCPKDDVFMLQDDPFSQGTPKSEADFKVEYNETLNLLSTDIIFWHFPGHTPGTSMIQIGNNLFTGDFIFQGSIGRVDFPFSSPQNMKNSLEKVLTWKTNFIIYPGHGNKTTLHDERRSLKAWINYI